MDSDLLAEELARPHVSLRFQVSPPKTREEVERRLKAVLAEAELELPAVQAMWTGMAYQVAGMALGEIGDTRLGIEHYEKAREHYRQSAKLLPDSYFCALYAANILALLGRFDAAFYEMDTVIENFQNSPRMYFSNSPQMELICLRILQQPEMEGKLITQAWRDLQDDPTVRYNYILWLDRLAGEKDGPDAANRLDEMRQAVSTLERDGALPPWQIRPLVSAYYRLARAEGAHGYPETALRLYEKVQEMSPDYAYVRSYKAMTLLDIAQQEQDAAKASSLRQLAKDEATAQLKYDYNGKGRRYAQEALDLIKNAEAGN